MVSTVLGDQANYDLAVQQLFEYMIDKIGSDINIWETLTYGRHEPVWSMVLFFGIWVLLLMKIMCIEKKLIMFE